MSQKRNLNLEDISITMNFVDTFIEKDMVSRDVSSITALTFSYFLTSFAAGWYIYYLYKKTKDHSEHLNELEKEVHETSAFVEAHADILTDYDQRIREKKDYDEEDEIDEDKCQAWKGEFRNETIHMKIYIWRDKVSTKKKNQEWLAWNEKEEEEKQDSSVVVRDFYLGNSNPEFKWLLESDMKDLFRVVVKETMINGWDSLIKLEITLNCKKKEELVHFIGMTTYANDRTTNAVLQKCIKEKSIEWETILMEN